MILILNWSPVDLTHVTHFDTRSPFMVSSYTESRILLPVVLTGYTHLHIVLCLAAGCFELVELVVDVDHVAG